jgi:glycosyltransferase involved in cell wall biosynthesis
MKFSVLMSIYAKENPIFFHQAMESITEAQSLRPDEIILVKDGRLVLDLDRAIDSWRIKLGKAFRVIELESNIGLGDALKIGLKHCSNELVARMDTDDIARFDRFEMQINFFNDYPNCDIVGSMITEFDKNPDIINSTRSLPKSHAEIIKYARLRNPFNHPSVIYKKSSVLAAGGYQKFHGFEDYYLWVRMIQNGARCANISEPLVNMRAGYSILSRRGGGNYAINEIKLQYKFLDLGFITLSRFIINLAIRIPVRFLPNKLRYFVYKVIRK